MIEISIDLRNEADELLSELIDGLSGEAAAEINTVAGQQAAEAAARYHSDFNRRGGWSRGRGHSSFGDPITNAWQFLVADRTGAVIYNDAPLYHHKVHGGTIRAKKAKFLTIPLIPEARGLRAATYVQNTGKRLFTIPGRSALFERVERGFAGGERVTRRTRGRHRGGEVERIRRTGGIRAVYALRRSVTQAPWPGALPPRDQLERAYADAWLQGLSDHIESL